MRIKRDKWSLKWKVIVFDNAHNHQLVTPSKRMKMKSNRHMPKAVKNEVQPKPMGSVGKNQEADDVLIKFLRLRFLSRT